jgi:hypothetical protein
LAISTEGTGSWGARAPVGAVPEYPLSGCHRHTGPAESARRILVDGG